MITGRRIDACASRANHVFASCMFTLSALLISSLFSVSTPRGLAFESKASSHEADDWDARLEQLRPQEPGRYLELAEEIEDAATSVVERELAKHLYALAGALEPERLGRSACLALAGMEEDEQVKRRLKALAALLPGAAGGVVLETSMATADWSPAAAAAVGDALSYYRRGDGPRALAALKAPGANALLQQYGRMLPGGYARFMEDCKAYKGQQAPTLSSADVIRMLRFESSILAGRERSWSSEAMLTGAPALIEIDPMQLEESLGVDASRPLYRKGRWVER